MKVNFLLPGVSRGPIGGYKVVSEYANKMSLDGMEVTLIYPIALKQAAVAQLSVWRKIGIRKKIITKTIKRQYSVKRWYHLEDGVKEKIVPYLAERFIPAADGTFATSWETAEWLNNYTAAAGKKWYLVQGFEDWSGSKEEIEKTWRFPFQKIVIARWLQDHAARLGESSTLVNNGLDFQSFYISNPIEKRLPSSVIMLYHTMEIKGSKDGLAALEIVKKELPGLTVTLFSTERKPDFIPGWMTYHQKPGNLRELYNQAAIFISPSWEEGWGLPRAEAMQCGCATIITDIGGHRDYGEPGKDLLLTPVKNPEAMAQAIIKLVRDQELRRQIAKSGNGVIQQFTWEAAYQKLRRVLLAG